jgi:cholesterol transport system auxiliary component
MKRALSILIGLQFITFGGCAGSLLETKIPVPTVYVLHGPAAQSGTTGTPSQVDLAVSQASASPGLNTERIAVIRDSRQLDYYLNAQWGAPLPQVAQAMVVETLQAQSLFRSVTTEQARVNANYWLELEVRDFQAEYAGDKAPKVSVTLVGSLIRIKDRVLLRVMPVTVSVLAEENRLSAVIAAFESAAQQASLTLGRETASTIAASAR